MMLDRAARQTSVAISGPPTAFSHTLTVKAGVHDCRDTASCRKGRWRAVSALPSEAGAPRFEDAEFDQMRPKF